MKMMIVSEFACTSSIDRGGDEEMWISKYEGMLSTADG
jgi:hypothetical protein